MALEEDLVTRLAVRLASEEMVEPDFVKSRRGREGGQVAADAISHVVSPYDHDGGVPAHVRPDPALGLLVARERGFLVGRDRVDVGGRDSGRETDLALLGSFQQLHEQEAGPGLAVNFEDGVEGVDPLFRLGRVDIGELMGDAVEDHVLYRRANRELSVVGRRTKL